MNYIESFNIDFNKTIDTKISAGKKSANKFIDSTESSIQKSLSSSVKTINSNINNSTAGAKHLIKNIDSDISKVMKYSPVQKYNSALDNFYAFLFKKLIIPFEPSAKMTKRDFSFLVILIKFILLVITKVNSYIIDNSIGKFIEYSERKVGYKLDGRKIGPKTEKKEGKKWPLLMKILKTILTAFAKLLDLILMAFTNQVDVFSNIVKDLLKK